MHRLDLSLYFHPKYLGGKEGGGGGVRTYVNSVMLTPREKSPLPEAQRRFKPTTLSHAEQ